MPIAGGDEYICAIDDITCLQKHIIEPIQKNSFYKHILASSVGSIVSTVALNPITVVKVKIQNVNPFAVSKTVSSTIRSIVNEKGFRGFYAGTPMGILMSVPNTILYMTAYEEIKWQLNRKIDRSSINHLIPGLAGGLARLFAVSIITPLELIRTIQTGGVGKSTTEIAREIVQNRGYRGLYGGWSPSILRDCPFSAIYWYSFETLRPVYTGFIHSGEKENKSLSSGEFSVLPTFLSGASASLLAASATHPFDVLKTQQQMAMVKSGNCNQVTGTGSRCTLSSCVIHNAAGAVRLRGGSVAVESGAEQMLNLRYLYTNGGVSALYRGLSMRLVSVIPASAIMVTIYEKIKSIEF